MPRLLLILRRLRHWSPAWRRTAIVVFLLGVPMVARAADALQNTVSFIAIHIVYPVVTLLGNLLLSLINIMIAVAAYNEFTRAEGVIKGYTVVRDVSNIFFIVVLLIIAFGTVLNIQSYKYNRLLSKLVIMAFLVNFAKVIAGFFIDVSQVVMLTFVSAFRLAAAGNLTSAFGIENLLNVRDKNPGAVSGYTLFSALLLAIALLLIAVIVVGVYVVVFLVRIIALWLLIVLSPLAFVLRTFPAGQKYASQWWENFSKYVICGPVIAFFLWLSLTIVATSTGTIDGKERTLSQQILIGRDKSGNEIQREINTAELNESPPTSTPEPPPTVAAAITEVSKSENLLSYIIAILLLLASMTSAQQLCGAAGKFVGQWSERAKRAAMFATGVTAAGVLLKKGQAGVEKSWQVTKGGAGALLGAVPGRIGRRLTEMGLNPAAYVRGWREAREEKKRRTQIKAVARGRNWAEKVQTSLLGEFPGTPAWFKRLAGGPKAWGGTLNLPHMERVEAGEEKKFADEFAHLSKEQMAAKASELQYMGGQDGKRYRRALALAAAKNGYMDDLMDTDEMRQRYGGKKTWTDPETGEVVEVDDELYDAERLNRFMYDFLGEDDQAMRTMHQIGEMGLTIGHPEYYGHSTHDNRTGKPVSRRITDQNRDTMLKTVTDSSYAEWRKRVPNVLMGVQQHGVSPLRLAYVFDPENPGALKRDPQTGELERRIGLGLPQPYHRKNVRLSFGGKPKGQLVQKGAMRTFEELMLRGAVHTEDGVFLGDDVDWHAVAYMLQEDPEYARTSFEQVAPELAGKPFRFRAYKVVDKKTGQTAPYKDEINVDWTRKMDDPLKPGQKIEVPMTVPRGPYGRFNNDEGGQNIVYYNRGGQPQAGPAAAGAPGGAPAGQPLADVEADKQAKYEAMKDRVAAYQEQYGNTDAYFNSDDYLKDQENQLGQEEFEVMQEIEQRGAAPLGGIASFASGASNVLGFNANTFAAGKFKGNAGLYMNDPEKIGEFLKDYQGVLQQGVNDIDQQLLEAENIEDEAVRERVKNGLQVRKDHLLAAQERIAGTLEDPEQLKELRLVNTGRADYSDEHVITHEGNHQLLNTLDTDGSMRGELLAQQSDEEKTRILAWAQKKFGNEKMGLEEAWEEYLAEGMTNAWNRWGDKSPDAAKLDPALLGRLQTEAREKSLQMMISNLDAIDPNAASQAGQTMTDEQRAAIVKAQQAKSGDAALSENDALKRHVAEGLLNATSNPYDRGVDAVRLEQSLMDRIQQQAQQKGVEMTKGVKVMTSQDPEASRIGLEKIRSRRLEAIDSMMNAGLRYGIAGAKGGAGLMKTGLGFAARKTAQGAGFLGRKLKLTGGGEPAGPGIDAEAEGQAAYVQVAGEGARAAAKWVKGRLTTGKFGAVTAGLGKVGRKTAAGTEVAGRAIGRTAAGAYQRINPSEEQKIKKTLVARELAQAKIRGASDELNRKKLARKELIAQKQRFLRENGQRDAGLGVQIQALQAERKKATLSGDTKRGAELDAQLRTRQAERRFNQEEAKGYDTREKALDQEIAALQQQTLAFNRDFDEKDRAAAAATSGLSEHDRGRLTVDATKTVAAGYSRELDAFDRPHQEYLKRSGKRFQRIKEIDGEETTLTSQETVAQERHDFAKERAGSLMGQIQRLQRQLQAPQDVKTYEAQLARIAPELQKAKAAGDLAKEGELREQMAAAQRNLAQARTDANVTPVQRASMEQELKQAQQEHDRQLGQQTDWASRLKAARTKKKANADERTTLTSQIAGDDQADKAQREKTKADRDAIALDVANAWGRYDDVQKAFATASIPRDLEEARAAQKKTAEAEAQAQIRQQKAQSYKREAGLHDTDTPRDQAARAEQQAAEKAYREAQRTSQAAATRVAELEKQAALLPKEKPQFNYQVEGLADADGLSAVLRSSEFQTAKGEQQQLQILSKWLSDQRQAKQFAVADLDAAHADPKDRHEAYMQWDWKKAQEMLRAHQESAPRPAPAPKPEPARPAPSAAPAVPAAAAPERVVRVAEGDVNPEGSEAIAGVSGKINQTLEELKQGIIDLGEAVNRIGTHLDQQKPDARLQPGPGSSAASDELSKRLKGMREALDDLRSGTHSPEQTRDSFEKWKRMYEDALHRFGQRPGSAGTVRSSTPKGPSAPKSVPPPPPPPEVIT